MKYTKQAIICAMAELIAYGETGQLSPINAEIVSDFQRMRLNATSLDFDIKAKWGETHDFKRVYGGGKVELSTLAANESVCWGDGETYYYLLTKK